MRVSWISSVKLITCGAVALTCAGFAQTAQTNTSPSVIVGVIGGKPLAVTNPAEEAVISLFLVTHGREPQQNTDSDEMGRLRQGIACNRIRNSVIAEGLAAAKARLAIAITQQEIDSALTARLAQINPESEARSLREKALAIEAAVRAVNQGGKDPDEVYNGLLAPVGITVEQWKIELLLGKTQKRDVQLQRMSRVSAPDVTKAISDVRPLLESEKLNAAIGLNDPEFQIYAKELKKAIMEKSTLPTSHHTYVTAKREQWWRSLYSSIPLSFADPALKDRCVLDDLGIVVN